MYKLLYILIFVLSTNCITYAQLKVAPNFLFSTKIGDKSNYNKLSDIDAKIIIIDFFGTWCAPCIKALPHLSEIKEKYEKDITLYLVSTENEEKLIKYAEKNKLSIPIIVDKDEIISNFFAPPSYPYTIILNANKEWIASVAPSALTNSYLDSLINNTRISDLPKMVDTVALPIPTKPVSNLNVTEQLAKDLLLAVKTGENPVGYLTQLASLSEIDLIENLKTNEQKIAFWLNVYNAFTNYALKNKPELYSNRKKFFKSKFIEIANKKISLDDVEHGILRRSKNKLSLGYFNKWFVNKFEKKHRVQKLDWRIHFALNCGAKSCPPIAFYNASELENQLKLATKNYLTSESIWNENKTKIYVPALMSWFRKDFGGKKNIIPILKANGIIPSTAQPKIKFKKYDWSLFVDNYSTLKN